MQKTTVAVLLTSLLLTITFLSVPATAHTTSQDYVACGTNPGLSVTSPLVPCGVFELHESTLDTFIVAIKDDHSDAPHYDLIEESGWIHVYVYAVHLDLATLEINLGTTGTVTFVHQDGPGHP